jgi:hypothetical protein
MRRLFVIASLVGACSFDPGGNGGSNESSSGTTTGTATTMATTVANTIADTSTAGNTTTAMPETSTGEPGTSSESGPPPVDLEHGFIRIHLRRSDTEETDPFVGTTRIQIIMAYEQCLFTFYADHPEYTQNGSMGAEIFGPYDLGGEGWLDRLCDVPVDDLIDCSVASIEQQLESVPGMRINYMVAEPIEDMTVAFGPMPTAALAGCDDPTMHLQNGGSVGGYDGQGTKIWEGFTFDPNSAATDSETPIVVDVVAN